MPATVNALPAALLSLFGAKQNAQYPRELLQTIAPTIDVLELYARNQASPFQTNQENVVGTTSNAATAITATTPVDLTTGGELVVPSDEWWFVFDVATQYFFSAHAGSVAEAMLFWQTGGAGGAFSHHPACTTVGFNTSDAALTRRGIHAWDRGYLVQPGAIIRQRHFGITVGAGGTVNYFSTFRLLRLRA